MGGPVKRASLLLPLLVLLAAVECVVGCSKRDAGDPDTLPAVDTELMAFLSEARALHHEANLREDLGDAEGAIAAMNRLVAAQRPHDKASPEVEEVLADSYARLAELRLRK